MAEVFISYRTSDDPFAAVFLDELLRERFGPHRVFRDSRTIQPGSYFPDELGAALTRASVFIVMIGDRWLRCDASGRRRVDDPDDLIRREVELAMRAGIRVIPVLVGKTPPLRAEDLPPSIAPLAHRQHWRLSNPTAQHELSRFVDGIGAILAEGPVPHLQDPKAAVIPTTAVEVQPDTEGVARGLSSAGTWRGRL